MATTLECLVKGGYITAMKVYKINARVDQKTLNELRERPNGHDWTSETYANEATWNKIHEDNKVTWDLFQQLTENNSGNYWARRVLLSTEAANAGITLPQVEWVISTMGVRRVYYDPRRELSVNVLATQTKSSAIQEGGRCGRVFPGKHLILSSHDEMDHQVQVDELPGVKVQKLDAVYIKMLKSLPRSLVEGLPWMEPMDLKELEVVYDRLISNSL
eukprot:5989683-Amphidinium_carterae.1